MTGIGLIGGCISLFLMVIVRNLLDGGNLSDKEVIEKCFPNATYLRKGTKKKYKYYQFAWEFGKEVNLNKIRNLLEGFLGKHVKVFFNRVLTIRVYETSLSERLEFPPITKKSNKKVVLGVGYDGPIYHNFEKFPHMVVAGHTGYGKTNFLRGLLAQIDGEVVLIDLKGSDDYHRVSAKNIDDAVVQLERIENEFRNRRKKRIFVIVDEAAEFLPPGYLTKKEKEPYLYCLRMIGLIASQGRSLKVNLIYCTQYPTADIIPRFVKQNAETRVVFRLPTEVGSGVALDESGAEKLPSGVWGRALYKTDTMEEIQTFLCEGVEYNVNIRDSKAEGTKDIIEIG